jgi:uncharacterized protein YbcI
LLADTPQRKKEGGTLVPDTRTEPDRGGAMAAVSSAMVALHKEQFGRGPRRARSNFAGADALVCVLEDVLLPAELAMVEMGDQQRVRESRMFFQVATAEQFITVVEDITGRKVHAFSSATDPDNNTVFEVFSFHPDASTNGKPPPPS